MGTITNLVPNKLHPITGEDLRPTVVTTWWNGSAMNDSLCGGLYNKDTEPTSSTYNSYFKWNFSGDYSVDRIVNFTETNFKKLVADFNTVSRTLIINKAIPITTNYTIPANISLRFEVGGSFTISNGVTLTILGNIINPNLPIFGGTGLVSFPVVGSVNAKWFGVTGDGVTNDYVALVRAIGHVNTNTRALFIPKGTYAITLDAPLFISAGVRISGEDGTVLNLNTSTPTFTNFLRNNGDNVSISNLEINRVVDQPFVMILAQAFKNFKLNNITITGNRDIYPTNYCHAIQMGVNNAGSSNYFSLKNSTIKKVSYGLFMTNESTATVKNVRISNCTFESNTATDLEFNSPNGTFSNVTVKDCTFSSGQLFGVGFAFIKNAKVKDCYFENYNEEAIHIEDYSEDILIEGNTFKSCALLHFAYVQIISGARRVRIVNNYIDASANATTTNIMNVLQGGVGSTPGGRAMAPPQAISFIGNDILISSITNGLYIESINNFIIKGNKMRGTGGVTAGAFSGANNYGIRLYANQFGEVCENDFRGINTAISSPLNTVNSLGEGLVLSNNGFDNCLVGILAYNAFPSTISNNTFVQCQYSIVTGNYSTGVPKNLLIYGNNAIRCTNPFLIYNYVKVTVTVAATIGTGKIVTISPLAGVLPSGSVITFTSGATLTLTAAAIFQTTTLTGNIAVSNIAGAETGIIYRRYSTDLTQTQTVFKNTDDFYGRSGVNFVKDISADYQVIGYEESIFITANTPTVKLPPAISWNTGELTVRNGSGSDASVTHDGVTDTITAGTTARYKVNEAGDTYLKY